MSTDLVVRGQVIDDRDEQIDDLRDQLRDLKSDLQAAKHEAQRARSESARALTELKKQLGPLYRALQMVFGEIEAAGVEDSSPASQAGDPRVSAVWESWKSRLGPSCARVIDALLLHGEMNTQQLAIAAGFSRQNISNLMVKINRAGLINKVGGRFSLKQL